MECVIEEERQWEELLSLSLSHKVLPMVYDSMGVSGAIDAMPVKYRGIWKSTTFQEIAGQVQKTAVFLKLYQQFLAQGLKCLVVKGIVCRNLYVSPDARISGDEDLYIGEKDFGAFRKICVENGFVCINEGEREWAFYHKESGLKLEAHLKLFNEHSKSLGNLNRPFAESIRDAVSYEIQGTKIWTMNETDHMLYLVLHSFKHFLHSGVGIRQICDIVMFAEHYGEKIHWKYVFSELRNVNADVFFMNLLDIGKKYFGFTYKKAGISKKTREHYGEYLDSKALLEDLLSAGVYGTSSESRSHSSLITLNAVAASKTKKSARGRLVKTVFPERKHMEGEYPFVKKHGWLLPVAWLRRIVRYGFELIGQKSTSNSAIESIQIGNKRVELLKKYKVI